MTIASITLKSTCTPVMCSCEGVASILQRGGAQIRKATIFVVPSERRTKKSEFPRGTQLVVTSWTVQKMLLNIMIIQIDIIMIEMKRRRFHQFVHFN